MSNELFDRFVSNFPFPELRDGQKDVLRVVADQIEGGKKFIIAECPTGTGKSPLALAIAKSFDNAYILTIQKFLQDQYMRDFGNDIVDLKGRNAYPCTLYKGEGIKDMRCDRGKCKTEDKKSFCRACLPYGTKDLSVSKCPYFTRVHEALNAQTCLMNFESFLFQSAVIHRFSGREIMIIDEAHQAESRLMSFVSISISDKQFRSHKIEFRKMDNPQKYAAFFREVRIAEIIGKQIELAQVANDPKAEDRLRNLLVKLSIFMKSADSDNWVSRFEKKEISNVIELKPIFVKDYAHKYLFNMADVVILMSATILSAEVVRDNLGIQREESYAFRMGHKFDMKMRPLIKKYAGSMNYKCKKETMPQLIRIVNEICNAYYKKRGLIHTHNFEIARAILDGTCGLVRERLLFQEDFSDKSEMLRSHESKEDSIIIAPAMHEGLDLRDDLLRFQIICKVPYPSFVDNPQLQARMEISRQYYDWLTAQKLVQSYGRGCRSMGDYADTFVLDSEFDRFVGRCKRMLPSWFKEAITDNEQMAIVPRLEDCPF